MAITMHAHILRPVIWIKICTSDNHRSQLDIREEYGSISVCFASGKQTIRTRKKKGAMVDLGNHPFAVRTPVLLGIPAAQSKPAGRLRSGTPRHDRTRAVTYATATKGSIGVYLDAIGTVTPVYTDAVTSQVTGVITAVHYREGQFVHKGDSLIDIDPRPYAANSPRRRALSNAIRACWPRRRWISTATRRRGPRTLSPPDARGSGKTGASGPGNCQERPGTVQYDKVELSFCHIASPIDGHVGLRLADPGNLVTANSTTTLVVVAQTSPITVVFTLPEDSLPRCCNRRAAAKPFPCSLMTHQQTLLGTGKLITVDNQIDTTTGTVKLRAQFDNSKGLLFPTSSSIRGFWSTPLKPDLDSVLHHSTQWRHDFVYVIQSGHAKMQNVKSGISDKGNTVVTHQSRNDRSQQQLSETGRQFTGLPVQGQAAILRRHGTMSHESVSPIHPAAGCYVAVDGCNSAGWHRRLHAVCRFRRFLRSTIRPSRCSRSIPAPAPM